MSIGIYDKVSIFLDTIQTFTVLVTYCAVYDLIDYLYRSICSQLSRNIVLDGGNLYNSAVNGA